MGGGKIVEIHGRGEWDSNHATAVKDQKLVVVDFTASWCGPCRIMAPVFEELSTNYANALFLKVDVDQNGEIAGECGVRGIPAFHLFKGGAKVDEVVGADQGKLRACVEKHYVAASFQGKGRTLGSADTAAPSTPSPSPSPSPSPGAPAASGASSFDHAQLDESRPITSIQVRLPDGTRLVGRFNTDDPVSKVRAFITHSRPDLPPHFHILNSYPPKPLQSYELSIEKSGLLSASLQIKI